jgi:hypothetical protein
MPKSSALASSQRCAPHRSPSLCSASTVLSVLLSARVSVCVCQCVCVCFSGRMCQCGLVCPSVQQGYSSTVTELTCVTPQGNGRKEGGEGSRQRPAGMPRGSSSDGSGRKSRAPPRPAKQRTALDMQQRDEAYTRSCRPFRTGNPGTTGGGGMWALVG